MDACVYLHGTWMSNLRTRNPDATNLKELGYGG